MAGSLLPVTAATVQQDLVALSISFQNLTKDYRSSSIQTIDVIDLGVSGLRVVNGIRDLALSQPNSPLAKKIGVREKIGVRVKLS